ncbi:DUF4158 domain-containing protein [Streptosporangium carneum]|uniref:DUF4158 domain-containing protein n=1 Tax=Streptosporangium carneum TaxID=47481 RepID=A0A9W6I5K6_9ACTN|nr:DUF4158 domain-containing protein [Streptosporangium carneum]GLK12512.1 hypothetical protein GCM10017600_59220 [Streptosporangium carneum]
MRHAFVLVNIGSTVHDRYRKPSRVLSWTYGRFAVPVEFSSDEQAAEFASFQGPPTRAQLEKCFFLDDADRETTESRRRDHNRLGFAVQIGVARFLRRFPPDTRQVPAQVGTTPLSS